jgi:hypothetical protein
LIGQTPVSDAFEQYVVSEWAGALLDVSAEWIAAGVEYVRYESLVQDTVATLRTVGIVQQVPDAALTEAIHANTLTNLRPTSSNYHYWQGKAGLWQSLIGRDFADRIYQRHRAVFDRLGYDVIAAQPLEQDRILDVWNRLAARGPTP